MVIGEDLVLVMIDYDILRIVVRGSEKAIPCVWGFESIRYDDWGVGNFADLIEAVPVKLACNLLIHIIEVESRFIDELNANDDVLVLGLCISLRDGSKDLQGLLHGVTSLPTWTIQPLA